jgi:hypothetical protein
LQNSDFAPTFKKPTKFVPHSAPTKMMQQVCAVSALLFALASLHREPSRWLEVSVPELETDVTVLVSSAMIPRLRVREHFETKCSSAF